MHIIIRQCYRSYIEETSRFRQVVIVQEETGSRKDSIYLAARRFYAMASSVSHFPFASKITCLHDQGGDEGDEP
jgi:hypothetical protein